MSNTVNTKVTLRHIYLEIGRMCNLKCEHCCKGEPENVAMSDEVMDALLDNVHFIDEITVSGGEPMLYVERMRTLLDKCRNQNIKVNYFNVITNCTMQSEEFVSVFNDWIDYCTFGDKNEFRVSTDKYHRAYISKHIKNVDVSKNMEWYNQHLKKCEIIINAPEDLDYDVFVYDEGRVHNWTESQRDKYVVVKGLSTRKNKSMTLPVKEVCAGEENVCKYGCVYNCIRSDVYMNAYGEMFLDTFTSFESQRAYKDVCICDILNESIYDAVQKWNEVIDKEEPGEFQTTVRDRTFDMLLLRAKNESYKAEVYARSGLFDEAEKMLNKVEYYTKFILNERNNIVDKWNNLALALGFEEDKEQFKKNLDVLKEKDRDAYDNYNNLYHMLNASAESITDIKKDIGNMRRILHTRKKQNNPGSLFVDPSLSSGQLLMSLFGL